MEQPDCHCILRVWNPHHVFIGSQARNPVSSKFHYPNGCVGGLVFEVANQKHGSARFDIAFVNKILLIAHCMVKYDIGYGKLLVFHIHFPIHNHLQILVKVRFFDLRGHKLKPSTKVLGFLFLARSKFILISA